MKGLRLLLFLFVVSTLIVGCGDDNKVSSDEIQREQINNGNPGNGSFDSLFNSQLSQCQANQGRLNIYFRASGGNANNLSGPFQQGRHNAGGSMLAGYIGTDNTGNFLAVRKFGTGNSVTGYELEFSICKDPSLGISNANQFVDYFSYSGVNIGTENGCSIGLVYGAEGDLVYTVNNTAFGLYSIFVPVNGVCSFQ